jgi:chaperonin cofactor prefoldin
MGIEELNEIKEFRDFHIKDLKSRKRELSSKIKELSPDVKNKDKKNN